ncbi:MAG TPA: hypothetical protein VGT41_04835 [Candidatus Babeliales bacterium]|nr:hypothetical protein [Candidatus Babeliales bacterium]
MNKPIAIALATITIVLLSGFGAETSTSGKKEHKINVKGTITTTAHPNKTQVENIAIGGLIEKIFFYPAPTNIDTLSDHILKVDPETEHDELDFVQDIKTIKVADANDIWHYQAGKNKMKQYILVEITLKNESAPKRYLLNNARTITCNVVEGDVVFERKAEPTTLKELTIISTIPRDQPKKQKSVHIPRTTQKVTA